MPEVSGSRQAAIHLQRLGWDVMDPRSGSQPGSTPGGCNGDTCLSGVTGCGENAASAEQRAGATLFGMQNTGCRRHLPRQKQSGATARRDGHLPHPVPSGDGRAACNENRRRPTHPTEYAQGGPGSTPGGCDVSDMGRRACQVYAGRPAKAVHAMAADRYCRSEKDRTLPAPLCQVTMVIMSRYAG